MDEKNERVVPLINLLFGAAAFGEALGRYLSGDLHGSKDSILAGITNLIAGVYPYLYKAKRINSMSGFLNILGFVVTQLETLNKPTTSISLYLSPVVHGIQTGTNFLEYHRDRISHYKKKDF